MVLLLQGKNLITSPLAWTYGLKYNELISCLFDKLCFLYNSRGELYLVFGK